MIPKRRQIACRIAGLAAVVWMGWALPGCPEGERPGVETGPVRPLPSLPTDQVVARIRNQMRLVKGALQAKGGFAKGYFTDVDGQRRSFNHNAAVLIYPPRHLRFDMKVLGSSVMLFGSNATRYWLATKSDGDALWWGRHSQSGALQIRGVTLQPTTIIEALGIGALSEGDQFVHRETLEHQQVLVLDEGDDGRSYVRKEYWIARRANRDLVRIVYRTPDGAVSMDANLSGHQPADPDGPSLPRRIEIDWPTAQGRLVFTCNGWKMRPKVDRSFKGFAFPLDRGESFERIVDIDREFGGSHTGPRPQTRPRPDRQAVQPRESATPRSIPEERRQPKQHSPAPPDRDKQEPDAEKTFDDYPPPSNPQWWKAPQ